MKDQSEYLADIEIAKIRQFISDLVMVEAVRKVFLEEIYSHGVLMPGVAHDPTQNYAIQVAFKSDQMDISDEAIGRVMRGKAEGIKYLRTGFAKLEAFKEEPKKKKKEVNEAL